MTKTCETIGDFYDAADDQWRQQQDQSELEYRIFGVLDRMHALGIELKDIKMLAGAAGVNWKEPK
jgi:hypothetical protein